MNKRRYNQLAERAFRLLGDEFRETLLTCPVSYTTGRIPKKNGGVRIINEPIEELKTIQKILLRFFYHWPTAAYIFGSQPHRSIIGNARFHIVSENTLPRWVVKLDLENAFPSATEELMEKVFLRMFEPLRVKDLLKVGRENLDQAYMDFVQLMLRLTIWNGRLPQGAPTSPYLLSLALVHSGAMKQLLNFCNKRAKPPRVSVYVDDITISFQDKEITKRTINRIIKIIEGAGYFKVNRRKTEIIRLKDKAPKITGVVLTHGGDGKTKLTLPQKKIRTYKGKIHRAAVILREDRLPTRERDGFTLNMISGYIGWVRKVYRGTEMPAGIRRTIGFFTTEWLNALERSLKKQGSELIRIPRPDFSARAVIQRHREAEKQENK